MAGKGYSVDIKALGNPKDLPASKTCLFLNDKKNTLMVVAKKEGLWRCSGFMDLAGNTPYELDPVRV